MLILHGDLVKLRLVCITIRNLLSLTAMNFLLKHSMVLPTNFVKFTLLFLLLLHFVLLSRLYKPNLSLTLYFAHLLCFLRRRLNSLFALVLLHVKWFSLLRKWVHPIHVLKRLPFQFVEVFLALLDLVRQVLLLFRDFQRGLRCASL
jgi:hypothetical protein